MPEPREDVQRYLYLRGGYEVEAVQYAHDNGDYIAERFEMEYVPGPYATPIYGLFLPGSSYQIPIGAWVIKPVHGGVRSVEMYHDPLQFGKEYKKLEVHPYVPEVFGGAGDLWYVSPCRICGNTRYDVPYHRPWVDGEQVTLSDDTVITLKSKGDPDTNARL